MLYEFQGLGKLKEIVSSKNKAIIKLNSIEPYSANTREVRWTAGNDERERVWF